jgi:hypothetical protein
MNLQAKQYEEWLQIMQDYSTVFSKGDEKPLSSTIDGVGEDSKQSKVNFYI